MASPVIGELRTRARGARSFSMVYAATLILSLHWAVVLYVNSTFLRQFVSDEAVGALYTIGSALSVISFFFISRVLRRFGNFRLTLIFAALECITLVGLAFADSLRVAIPLFVLHHALAPLLLFNLDIFTEKIAGASEKKTGGTRGMVLTIISVAGALAPLSAGLLLGDGEPRFALVYGTSALLVVLFGVLIGKKFGTIPETKNEDINVLDALRHFWVIANLRFVFLAHFLLQLFFAWMVIYVPLYLATIIGFSWSDIGLILAVGLSAYILCEYPIGEIADRYIGEKEMMAAGFIVIAVSTAYIGLVTAPALIGWMVLMFMTRVGASLVETTTESYFFKHTKGTDTNIISFFRATRPLAYMLGALFGSAVLLYVELNSAFFFLALLMLPGIVFALLLKDTK